MEHVVYDCLPAESVIRSLTSMILSINALQIYRQLFLIKAKEIFVPIYTVS